MVRCWIALVVFLGSSAIAQERDRVVPLEDQWRALVGAEWARFEHRPNTFRYDLNGHGGIEFSGALKDPPFAGDRSVEKIEGVLFLQCPTRRAAVVTVRLLDAHGDRIGAQFTEPARLTFLFPPAGSPIDTLVEGVCTNTLANLRTVGADLGYRPTRPALEVQSIRDIALGARLPMSIPECGALTPSRHAELLVSQINPALPIRCAIAGREPVLLMSPDADDPRRWANVGSVELAEGRVKAAYNFLDGAVLDRQMTRMVTEFGLPTEVRVRADPGVPGGRSREFAWIGADQVLTLIDREYFPRTKSVLTVTGLIARSDWNRQRRPVARELSAIR